MPFAIKVFKLLAKVFNSLFCFVDSFSTVQSILVKLGDELENKLNLNVLKKILIFSK